MLAAQYIECPKHFNPPSSNEWKQRWELMYSKREYTIKDERITVLANWHKEIIEIYRHNQYESLGHLFRFPMKEYEKHDGDMCHFVESKLKKGELEL